MTPPPQKIYVQRDGTLVPHSSRPVSARVSDLISSFVLFLTLFWHSLFQTSESDRTKGEARQSNGGSRLGGGGGSGGSGDGSGSGRRIGTVNDIRSPECAPCNRR